ncbi:MAG: adenylate kinase [Victivallales bacterium]
MISKRNLVFLGAPGAGKGTLAQILCKEMKLAHISTGDILRSEIKNGTELGKKAQSYVTSGGLVPDDLVADMVAKRLLEKDCQGGFVLDGFPRTVNQADLLEKALIKIGRKLDGVVYFEAPEDLLIKRLTARLMCRKCNSIYNTLFTPPTNKGVCDKCGTELFQRPDDSLETAKDRLKVYNEQTAPLVPYYKNKKMLATINAELPKDKSYPALIKVLS